MTRLDLPVPRTEDRIADVPLGGGRCRGAAGRPDGKSCAQHLPGWV